MDSKNSFLTTPVAILLGSFVISVSILIHGGVIKLGQTTTTTAQPQAAAQAQQPAAPTVTQDTLKALFNDKNITFGNKDSKNIIVEVADPSCPYCHVAAGHNPTLNKQIGDRFVLDSEGGTYMAPVPQIKKAVDEGKAAFVWLYTPGHGNGEMGTKAMYCAHEKGKFWPVHDKLMTSQGYDLLNEEVKNDKSKTQDLVDFLSDAMSPQDLKSCLESGKYDDKLSEDTATAQNLGISGTPGFFVNTTNFGGAYSWKDMQSALK